MFEAQIAVFNLTNCLILT